MSESMRNAPPAPGFFVAKNAAPAASEATDWCDVRARLDSMDRQLCEMAQTQTRLRALLTAQIAAAKLDASNPGFSAWENET